MSRFNPESRARIVARLELGAAFKDAASRAGVRPETARGWLTRGRRESDGLYTEFAAEVDRARAHAGARRGPLTERELRLLVSDQVRAGSVQAARLYWRMLQHERKPVAAEGGDTVADLDELARRRQGGAVGRG